MKLILRQKAINDLQLQINFWLRKETLVDKIKRFNPSGTFLLEIEELVTNAYGSKHD